MCTSVCLITYISLVNWLAAFARDINNYINLISDLMLYLIAKMMLPYSLSLSLSLFSSRTRLEALTFINKVLCQKIVLQHLIGTYVQYATS